MPDLDHLVVATQARVLVRATPAELEPLARAVAADPSIFDTNPPYFWTNEISSDRLDGYFTRMSGTTTLPNFANEAAAGVAFLAGHNNRVLPFGYTLTGTLEAGTVTRVLADAYTLDNLELGGVKTRDFITGVKAGVVRDVSVGFYGGRWICSVCGRDMWHDWDCWHIPGLEYEVKEEGQNIVRLVLASATIEDAHLSEVSAVYDGATPGAAILRAQQEAERGRVNTHQAQLLEQRYRINLPGQRIVVPGSDIPKERTVDPEQTAAGAGEVPVVEPVEEPTAEAVQPDSPVEGVEVAPETPTAEVIEAAAERLRSIDSQVDAHAAIRGLLGIGDGVEVLAAVRALQTQAEDGRAYRANQIDAAIAEGVRALGSDFDEDAYRAMLATAPIATVQRMKGDWEKIASTRFVGGRRTFDQAPAAPASASAPVAPSIPDAAFAG